TPHLVGSAFIPDVGIAISSSNGLVYATRQSGQLVVLAPHCGGAPTDAGPPASDVAALRARVRLLAPYPNPANPTVVIPVATARPVHGRLTIHDVAGREIARLLDGPIAAGTTPVHWSGLDSAHRPVAAGVYFARLVTSEGTQARKIVIAK